MSRPLGNLQRSYWTRLQQANYHFIADEVGLGLDVCFDLLLKPDLSNFLRALVNVNVLEYADIRRYPGKMRLLQEYYTLVAGMEQSMGLQNAKLIWLKNHFEPVKLQLDQEGQGGLGSFGAETGKADDDILMGDPVPDKKDPISTTKEEGDDSITQMWEDATEAMEGLTVESPRERDPSLPPLPSGEQSGSGEQNGAKYPTPDPTSDIQDPTDGRD